MCGLVRPVVVSRAGRSAAALVALARPAGLAYRPSPVRATHATWDGIVPAGVHAGDSYHILFVTITNVKLTDAEWTDIANWNAAVQAVADTQTAFSGVTFKILGSTADVDALDNTNTNNVTATDGTGDPIYCY